MSLFHTLAAMRRVGFEAARRPGGSIVNSVSGVLSPLKRAGLSEGLNIPSLMHQVVGEAENYRRLRQIRNPALRPTRQRTMLPKALKTGDEYAYVVQFKYRDIDGVIRDNGVTVYSRRERLSMQQILDSAMGQVLEHIERYRGKAEGVPEVDQFEVTAAYYNELV
jgi:hypothetical protein